MLTTECKASSSEEPGAVIPHAGICAGGARQRASLPRFLDSADKVWGQGVGTRCGDKVLRQGVETRCRDKVWRQGVETRCKRGAPTLNPHLNSLLNGTLHPLTQFSLACPRVPLRAFTCIRVPSSVFSRFSRLKKHTIHSRPFASIRGSVSPCLRASVRDHHLLSTKATKLPVKPATKLMRALKGRDIPA